MVLDALLRCIEIRFLPLTKSELLAVWKMLLHDKHVAELEHAVETASVGDQPPATHWDPETMSAEDPAEQFKVYKMLGADITLRELREYAERSQLSAPMWIFFQKIYEKLTDVRHTWHHPGHLLRLMQKKSMSSQPVPQTKEIFPYWHTYKTEVNWIVWELRPQRSEISLHYYTTKTFSRLQWKKYR